MSRRLLTLLAVLALAVGVLTPIAAGAADGTADLGGTSKAVEKSATGSYIVVMVADPLLEDFAQDELGSKAAEAKAKGLKKGHDKALKDAGVSTSKKVNEYVNALNGFSAPLSYDEALALAAQPDVALVLPDEMHYPTTDNSPTFLEIDAPGGPWSKDYTGEGVVIGVIDTGIWPEHASFADDGSYAAPPITIDECDFGNTAHNADDAPFTCNNKLIGARQMLDTYRFYIGAEPYEFDSARDENGHGTHTASTAGGNAGVEASIFGIPRGTVSGIAPRAHIVAYKGLGDLGGFSSDLAASIDQAVADGVDVINYSIGGGSGLTGPDDIAFLFAASAGVFVATSGGNSGPGPDTVGSPGNAPWLTTVGASTQNRTFEGSATLGNGAEYFGASVTDGTTELPLVDAADLGNELCLLSDGFSEDITGKIVLCLRGAVARVQKSETVAAADGAGMILYNANDGQSQVTDNHFVPSVHINNTKGLEVKAYIADAGAGATATINGGEFTWIDGNSMAAFSSRGPNGPALDIIKPDVTAPGVNILAGHTPVPAPGAVSGELFQSISGTSMSSPHVAGVFALIKQAHPDWSAAMAKSAIMTTARQDIVKEDGSTAADPFDFGAGHIVPGSKASKGSAFDPGLVYDAGLYEYAAFTCGSELGVFTAGSCTYLEAIGVPTDPSDLNVASIGIADLAGTQTVERTVTSVASGKRTFSVSVEAPDGYLVSVSPSTITLAEGQSATYDVTFTADGSVAAGEWSFGSLTWSDKKGKWSARSPIALRGAMFDAPELLELSGEAGSASFDVLFGYTGAYAADAHGLEAAVVTSDNVVQDPDQTFDPGDGFSNRHDFALSGAAYFKIAMPPEAVADASAIDLDVFVYGPSGHLEASSTSGGTDEVIEIELPADGTWSVFVHGWQTAGPNADYDMYSWVISATPGGSLVVDNAPTSATSGVAETIDISWSGATAGGWYLGAVSHTGDDGLMGLTFVDIDNR